MTGWQRLCWWGLALLGAGAAVGLLVWVTAVHPDGSAQAWGVAGSVAGVAALGVSLWQLRAPRPALAGGPPAAPPSAVPPPGPVEPPESAAGQRGAIVARGNVTGSSTRYTGPTPPASAAPQGGPAGLAGSDGAIVAGQDVEDSHTEYGP